MRIIKIGNTITEAMEGGAINSDQAMMAAIFGGKGVPNIYDEEVVYNKGDKIVEVSDDGKIKIFSAKEDNITGNFDENKWKVYTSGADSDETKATFVAVFGTTDLPEEYDSDKTYSKSERVLHNGLVYIATEDGITGDWNENKWVLFAAGDDTGDIQKVESDLKTSMFAVFGSRNLPDPFDPNKVYFSGTKVTYGGIVYVAKENVTGNWNPDKWKVYVAGDDSEAIEKAVDNAIAVNGANMKLINNNSIVANILGI